MAIELTFFLVSFLSLGMGYLMVVLSEFNFIVYWYRKGRISSWKFWKLTEEDKQFIKDAPEYMPSRYQTVLANLFVNFEAFAYYLIKFIIAILICNLILGRSLFSWLN